MKTVNTLIHKYIKEYFSMIKYNEFVSEQEKQCHMFKKYILDILDVNIVDIYYSGTDYIELRIFDFSIIYTFDIFDENYIITCNNTIHSDATFEEIKNVYDRMLYIKTQLDNNIIEFKQKINMMYLYNKNYDHLHDVIYQFFNIDSTDLEYVERCLKLKIIELV